ncbi:PREDICTED: uncharacterized protein LOC104739148 isoform X3 [Camelina sativa]|uniref:Uncharacterized protein LOC104739148 isoform X3 n=1 Tax=Camelina sativa TaxID=90675 RepID=A0ABM0VKS9_CAMSA|nr:PREDICTED: uncharacterized protein LOC104739148 isoform X3 [Camelina sativa]
MYLFPLQHLSHWLVIANVVDLIKLREMGREKSPGLKILWVWTIGTAAIFCFFSVLVTSVVRTRMQDMQTMMNQNQEQAPKRNQNASAVCGCD